MKAPPYLRRWPRSHRVALAHHDALGYTSTAPWWWWKRDRCCYCHGAATMLAAELILNVFGIGLFCWLIFTLAVYALPFFVGLAGRHGVVSLRRGRRRGVRRWHHSRSADARSGPSGFLRRPPLNPPRHHRCGLCNSGGDRGLPCDSRTGAARGPVFDLARNSRLDRRDPHRRHRISAHHLSRRAAPAAESKWPLST